MLSEDTWQAVRHRATSLAPEAVLVTPGQEEPFTVEGGDEDRLVVRFRDDEERPLRRDQFDVLADGLRDRPIDLEDLPPGVGPYVAVLSLAPGIAVDEAAGEIRATTTGCGGPPDEGAVTAGDDGGAVRLDAEDVDSPFVRSRWAVRHPPERVHDDAVLVADYLERHDATDPDDLDERGRADLYVLLSDLQWGADDLRRSVGDDLLDHLGPEGRIHGQFGTVSQVHREYRQAKDDEAVLAVLDEAGVPREWVLGVDEDKLDVVIAATDVAETDVYDVEDRYHVQKTGVESEAKRSRLQGLRDRLADLRDEDADEIRDEIEALEARIDDLLAAG